MKLRVLVNGMAAACALLLALLVVALTQTYLQFLQARSDSLIVDAVRGGTNDLRFLMVETILYDDERSMQQWDQKHASVLALLEQRSLGTPRAQALLNRMRGNHLTANTLYKRMIGLMDTGDKWGDSASVRELKARTVSLLLVVTQDMRNDAIELDHIIRARVEATQEAVEALALITVFVVGLIMSGIWWLMRRRVLRPLSILEKGTANLAAGHLEFRLGLKRQDEIGSLARSFDTMTERLQSSHVALAKSEELKTSVLKDAAAAIIATDSEGFITVFNPGAEMLLGYSSDEVLGRQTPALFHDPAEVGARTQVLSEELGIEIVPGFDTVIAKARATGQPDQNEWTYIHRDGTRVPVLLSVTARTDAQGQIIGYLGIAKDITERMLNQQHMEQLLRRQQTILDNDLIGIVTTRDRKIVWANRAFEQMLGYAPGELVGTPTRQNYPSDEAYLAFGEAGYPVLAAGHVYRAQMEHARKDGSVIWVDVSGTMLDQEQSESLWGFLDITERKQHEAILVEAMKRAEAADQAKSEFLANMSHEIRTPMNAILGLSHLVGLTALTAEQQDYIDKIATAGKSLLGILNDILDFSKIEANRLDISHINFRVNKVFDDLAAIMSVNGAAKNLELAITCDPNIPRWVNGDPSRLLQILVNIAGNAIKFTHTGSITVKADLAECRINDTLVRFTVRDTGIGISGEQLDRLFQPFVQADATTTRRFGGTGLGLVISKRLVELMGGTIGVESAPGRGSEFWFIVPFAHGQEEPEAGASTILSKQSVLIADDNTLARESLSAIVENLGWQDDVVESGSEAINRYREHKAAGHPYDILLFDWQMPQMNGLEAARRIKTDPLTDAAPIVIMVSGFSREEVLRSPDAMHIDAVLIKPITESALYRAVGDIKAHRDAGVGQTLAKVKPLGNSRLEGVRILVVEDNAINQEVARKILQREGASVDVVDDGSQAVGTVRKRRSDFDLVLMDAQMPVMDGFEATAIIRSDLGEDELPIIALTAGVQQADRDKCLRAGMTDFVAKPLDVDQLVNVIRRYVTSRPDARSSGLDLVGSAGRAAPSLQTIPGMDVRDALLRLGGDEALLRSLLRSLAASTVDLGACVRADLRTNDHQQAARRMHSIRGGAGNIGAVSLSSLAQDFEAAILQGRTEEIPKFLEELDVATVAFRAGVLKAIGDADELQVAQSSLDTASLRRLIGFLREGNLGALDVYRNLAAGLKASITAEQCDALSKAIEKLDFSAAAAILDAAGLLSP